MTFLPLPTDGLSLSRDDDGVLTVTLDRPEKLNALTFAMIDGLRALFSDLRTRDDLRVVVIRGAGRAFCAGLDLDAAAEARSSLDALGAQRRLSDLVVAMRRCPQPVVALVHGAASGAGFALALASDIRLASDGARMNAAFIRIGLSGCDAGVSYFLPRLIGPGLAAEYLMTGRFMDAREADRLGVARLAGSGADLESSCRALLEELLRASPVAMALTKEALAFALDAPSLESAIAMEDRNQVLCMRGEDFSEALDAFRGKREPRFGAPPGPPAPAAGEPT